MSTGADELSDYNVGRQYRTPVHYDAHQYTFVDLVKLTAEGMAIVDQIYRAFVRSPELAMLRRAYAPDAVIELVIDESRKYTKFRMPNCQRLLAEIKTILTRERCEFTGREYTYPPHTDVQFSIPRLGVRYHRFIYDSEGNHQRTPAPDAVPQEAGAGAEHSGHPDIEGPEGM